MAGITNHILFIISNNELAKVGELEGPSCNGRFVQKNLGQITLSNIANFVSEHGLATGQFKDIYPGCEITIMDGTYNAVWVCAGLDTEYNRGDIACPHGASFIPKVPLFNAQMNSTNTNSGGYAGSVMHKSTLPMVANNLKKALGGHLLNRRVSLSNSANGAVFADTYCTLLTENQVYGSRVFGASYDTGEGDQILPIFKFINHVYYNRSSFWLRALHSSDAFCNTTYFGTPSFNGASASLGVVPLIVIG